MRMNRRCFTGGLAACALLVALAAEAFGADAPKSVVRKYGDGEVTVNYDEAAVAPYALEDPLVFADGRPVRTPEDWRARRAEILGIFAREMYGAEPPAPGTLVTDLADERIAAGGFAICRQFRMHFRADRSGPCINWIVWIPRYAKRPVPVISFLNYRGNYELVPDAHIPIMTGWKTNDAEFGVRNNRVSESLRGSQQDPNRRSVFPLGVILARGYAVMSACYCEVSPDPHRNEADPAFRQEPFAYTGVFELWGGRDPARTDNTTSLGAWAWALSRALDLAERIPEIDAKKAVVTGCSRLGKAAFLAAARDERFAVCVPNQCGGGGVCLAKRNFGESIATEIRDFRHWYCRAYDKYESDPARLLTFDQHLLLAAIAPRAVLVEGMTDSPWMDTKGEYLACKAAAPVWAFLGKDTMPDVAYPDDFELSAVGGQLGYVRRREDHGLAACDWVWMLDFADRNLR